MTETILKRWDNELVIAGIAVLLLLPLFGMPPKTYLTLTIAGLAMGMLLFLVASGVSIILGLMDVLNFAHGALFAWGAYVGFSTFKLLEKWVQADSVLLNFGAFAAAIICAMTVVAVLGMVLERVIVRRVYGNHLFQILITFGATIVLVEMIRVIWGPNDDVMSVPLTFQGNWDVFDVIIDRYRIICILIGALVFGAVQLILKKTKLGLIVRAGVENRDMVQAMGHNIFLLFTGVFAVGAGLAALGGLAMSIFSLQVYPDMGSTYLLFAFIVVIIGGLGSVTGSLVGALIVGLSYNYVAYLVPWAAAGVNIIIMIIILLIRPKGLFTAGK
ncbi:amino acid/amide ABC transporter membrane protein 1, HAAT family [Desulfatibacillum alkenivorans DSM 16219]|jgi:branched-chain amino acid transport system permease protein|uniref:Amino acid/amide ABC transporter membrane protein 1, HAAT family n=1 Tax=Desulfatibacillum alkenivorans DSM 16219 TaxID=1121393 RepID=A0A1M6YKG3_9BACT|nr:branched-chain amino acid ABC transporter permease [Desulfatibacillum alkenivorans]SHL18519.1 amino acid/amide ABC transporter membrane protein 1, HAAT family [Desulfatibacillum alkenivorans DSM 16219]